MQSVEDGKASTTETVYTLESKADGKTKITSVYGTPIALTVQQQTVTKNGNDVTAGSKTEVTENITYTWQQSGQSESKETAITGSTFRPEKAGTYILTAYQNYSDTSKRTKLASTTITVKRKPLELYVTWSGDNENHNSTEAPDNKSAFEVKSDALESGDTLILYLNFRQDAAGNEPEFAANCAAIVQAAKAAGWNFTTMNFGTEEDVGGVYDTYRAEFSQSFADGLTTEQLARRVQKGYYYNYDCYDSKEARDNAIKADLRKQISNRYADEHDDVYPSVDYLNEETERQFNALYGSQTTEIATPESAE